VIHHIYHHIFRLCQ